MANNDFVHAVYNVLGVVCMVALIACTIWLVKYGRLRPREGHVLGDIISTRVLPVLFIVGLSSGVALCLYLSHFDFSTLIIK